MATRTKKPQSRSTAVEATTKPEIPVEHGPTLKYTTRPAGSAAPILTRDPDELLHCLGPFEKAMWITADRHVPTSLVAELVGAAAFEALADLSPAWAVSVCVISDSGQDGDGDGYYYFVLFGSVTTTPLSKAQAERIGDIVGGDEPNDYVPDRAGTEIVTTAKAELAYRLIRPIYLGDVRADAVWPFHVLCQLDAVFEPLKSV